MLVLNAVRIQWQCHCAVSAVLWGRHGQRECPHSWEPVSLLAVCRLHWCIHRWTEQFLLGNEPWPGGEHKIVGAGRQSANNSCVR